MNEKLIKRLNELNLKMENILEIISPSKDEMVFVYTSQIEGLGTWSSDFDVYVLSEKYPDIAYDRTYNDHKVRMPEIDTDSLGINGIAYLSIDIEYWTFETVLNLLHQVKQKQFIDSEKLKMLLRIRNGEMIYSKLQNNIRDEIMKSDFISYSIPRFSISSDADLHDCISLWEFKDYYGAMICGRQALNEAISGLNAKHGNINFNIDKWSSRIFINNNGYGNKDYLKKYLRIQFFNDMNEDNIGDICYELIIFVQNILNKELGFLGKKHWLQKENYKMLDEENDFRYKFK